MKRNLCNRPSVVTLPKAIISFFLSMLSTHANATDFVDIIRMTAEHPSILSAQNSAGAAMFDVDAAKAPNNLQLSTGISSTGYSGQPGVENNYISPYINISKILYDHGRSDAVVQGKEAEYQMQRAQIMATREALNQQALTLFTSALTNAKIVEVLDKEVTALQDLLKRVQSIASIDPGRASEVNQVATRLNSVIASREANNTTMQQSWQQLALLVNKPVKLTHELPDLKKAALLPASFSVAENALRDNPSFIVTRHRRDAAAAAMQAASKWNRPKWNAQLILNSPRNNGDMELFKAATLQLSSDMSLWDGGSGIAVAKGEVQRLASAEEDVNAVSRNLKQQLSQLWVSLPPREKQIAALSRQSASALKTWRAGETQFFAGQRPLTDLISFATDYYSSLASYEEQRVQYIASQWQIVAALGKLSELAKNATSLSGPSLKSPDMEMHNSIFMTTADYGRQPASSLSVTDEEAIEKFRLAASQKTLSATEFKNSGDLPTENKDKTSATINLAGGSETANPLHSRSDSRALAADKTDNKTIAAPAVAPKTTPVSELKNSDHLFIGNKDKTSATINLAGGSEATNPLYSQFDSSALAADKTDNKTIAAPAVAPKTTPVSELKNSDHMFIGNKDKTSATINLAGGSETANPLHSRFDSSALTADKTDNKAIAAPAVAPKTTPVSELKNSDHLFIGNKDETSATINLAGGSETANPLYNQFDSSALTADKTDNEAIAAPAVSPVTASVAGVETSYSLSVKNEDETSAAFEVIAEQNEADLAHENRHPGGVATEYSDDSEKIGLRDWPW